MRAVPVGVASIVPHVTVRGNGGVWSYGSGFRRGLCGDGAGGLRQRGGAVTQFLRAFGNCGTAPVR